MAMLSMPAASLLDHNGPGKGPFDGGGQDQDNLLTSLMEKLKMTSKQVKAWSEERLKIRDAMAVYKNTDNVDPERLQKCLENIKKAITVSSLPAMVERLEALARPVNLKVMSTPEGNIFISSDTFYVEVIMGENGNVKDVMVAHCKDPVSCPEMCEALGQSNFKDFGDHLRGLSDFYQTGGDASQKSKAFNSLQWLEKDLLTILSITKKAGSTPLTVVKNSLGYCTPRAGGRHMRLTYFVSPYDLLDLEQEQSKELGPDDPLPKDIGLWVSIGLENSTPRKLQTAPLIIPNTTEGKLTHNSTTLGPNNSVMLPAVFTLNLSQQMPVSVTLLKQLQAVVGVTIGYSEPPTALPMNTLICHHTLNPNFATDEQERNVIHPRGYTFHVNLPDQKQRYYVTDSPLVADARGILITKISFVQHSQVIQTINCLRKQANYNALIASCVRKNIQESDESEEVFEVTAYHQHKMTVLFEHPAKDGMACVEFDTSDAASPKCKLHPREGEEPFCSEEYATKVLQKCLSIPITMRAILKKADDWLKTRKQKQVPAAATPAVGPSLFPSPQVPPPGPFSTLQKLTKQPFGGSMGTSYNAAKMKEPTNTPASQKFQGSILSNLTSSMASFFPQNQSPSNYVTTPSPSALSPPAEPLLSPKKPSLNPMLTSLLQGTTMGGGPPARKMAIQQVKEPIHAPLPGPPLTPTSPAQKHPKHPMLLAILQEQNVDTSMSTSLQANKAKKRKKRIFEKSPKLLGDDEMGPAGRDSNQDVFTFSKLSSMPLLQQDKSKPLPQQSPVSEMFSTFDPNKPNPTLTEFYALLNKPLDQSKTGKKKQSRSESIGSVSNAAVPIAQSPRQSPKTPMSPPTPMARPPRSISSTPELTALSPNVLPAPSPNVLPVQSPGVVHQPVPSPTTLPAPSPSTLPAPSPNVLPGMITEMLPQSDPLPDITTPDVLSPLDVPAKVLSTPSHQPPIDPFDFNEDIIQKNVPNFDDMFGHSKSGEEEFSVDSAIAKLDSAPGLDSEEEDKGMDVGSLLSMSTVPPIKPTISGTRSLSLDLQLPSTASLKPSIEGAMDLANAELPLNNSSKATGAKELRSPPLPLAESPLPSPKKNMSKPHTSKGKPKNFAVEGVGSFQTDVAKQKPKRSKKAVKEPSGQTEQALPKKGRKRKKKRYNSSSPECPTGEDYETTVRSEQPLKMTIKLKPVAEPKPKAKTAAPVTKIKVKALPALDSSASPSPVQQEEPPEAPKATNATGSQGQQLQIKKDAEDTKKDKPDKTEEASTKKDPVEGAKAADPPEKVVVKKAAESQRIQENRKVDDRQPTKLPSKPGIKSVGGPKMPSKGRVDGPRRPSHGGKPEVRKQSPEDILSAILPKAVSYYKIPKLKKASSQDTAPKVGPDGDGANLPELLKKLTQTPTHAKSADTTRLSSPKRTPNPSLQRPRSASPSIRYDPNKRFEIGKGGSFTKPVPGQKGGSISPRASVSPQGGLGNKGSSPTYKKSPSPQLRVPLASGSSPGLPKSTGTPGSTGQKSASGHSGHSPSYTPKTSGGSSMQPNAKSRPTGTTGGLAKAGSSPNQHSRSLPAASNNGDKTSATPASTKSLPVAQVKPSQILKPAQGPLTQTTKVVNKPPPLNLSQSAAKQAAPAADSKANTPAPMTPQTPSSASSLSGQRIKSPPAKRGKTASLNAIVSKLTERVHEKTVGDGATEKGEDLKKIELSHGDKDQVVKALLSSGHVEKVQVTTSAKVNPAKSTVKEDPVRTSQQGLVSAANKSNLSQTRTAVAQALKNIAKASKQETHPASKSSPSSAAAQALTSKSSQNNKVTTTNSKSAVLKTLSTSEKSNSNTQSKSDSSVNKVATQPKVSQSVSKTSGVSSANKTTPVAVTKPKVTIPPPTKSNQSKTLHSPPPHRPIILSKSSSTVTSPDKGSTKVTRIQIAPAATPVATSTVAKSQAPKVKQDQKKVPSSVADQKDSNPKSGSDRIKPSSDKDDKKKTAEPVKKETTPLKNAQLKETASDANEKAQENLKNHEGRSASSNSDTAPTEDNPNKAAAAKEDKKSVKKPQTKVNAEKPTARPSLKRTVSNDGSIDMPKKILKVSLSHDEVSLAHAPGGGLGPLSPKAVNKVVHKMSVPKTSPSGSKTVSQSGKVSIMALPTDKDFKVPSPAMMPPSPRTMLHGVRSPGLSCKPSSPTKATSPVSPGIPSPGEPATGGVPSPQGVKRAATPEESALPTKRSMLLDSCSPVSPADSDEGLVIDIPGSPSIRRPKTLADKVKDISEGSNSRHHKSPLPQSPLVKSPSIPLIKSPAAVSTGSGDAESPLDDDLMNVALSSVREDSLLES